MKKTLSAKGFTLIELLIVIAIIGILSSIILLSLNASRGKAKDVRVLSSVRQIRTTLEADFFNNAYADLTTAGNQVANINTSGPGGPSIIQLLQDAGQQNGNGNIATIGGMNYDLFTDGTNVSVGPGSGSDSGVVIFTTNNAGLANDYAIYATTTVGYVCIDSQGNTQTSGVGPIAAVPLDSNSKVYCH